MSSVVRVLALVGAAAAIPYHGQGHAHLHHPKHYTSSASGTDPSSYSTGAPYPIANGTAPATAPTGTGLATYTSTSTNYVTLTSTVEYYTTSGSSVSAADATADCTTDVTVTTKIYETVTVTPGSSSASSTSGRTTTIYQTSTIQPGPGSNSTTIEVSPVEPSSSAPNTAVTYSSVNKGHSWRSKTSSSTSAYVAPTTSSESSSYVASTTSSSDSSSYVAPTSTSASSSYVAPTSTSETSVYVAPTTASTYVAPSTSSSSAPAPSATYSAGTGTGKRGVAYNDASLTGCFSASQHVSWGYNWGSASSGLSSAWNYIPMLWGPTSAFTQYWDQNVQAALAAGAKTIFSFNEPDMSSQSNLTPKQAADAYRQYVMPYAGKAQLCAPSVTNGGGAMGLDWLVEFMSQCSDCQIDCVNIHWYAEAEYTDYFKQHVQNATDISNGKPVYLSEFGTTNGGTEAFLQEVMPWLDSQEYVHGYAYFMVADGLLVSGTEPSSYGSTYATFSS